MCGPSWRGKLPVRANGRLARFKPCLMPHSRAQRVANHDQAESTSAAASLCWSAFIFDGIGKALHAFVMGMSFTLNRYSLQLNMP